MNVHMHGSLFLGLSAITPVGPVLHITSEYLVYGDARMYQRTYRSCSLYIGSMFLGIVLGPVYPTSSQPSLASSRRTSTRTRYSRGRCRQRQRWGGGCGRIAVMRVCKCLPICVHTVAVLSSSTSSSMARTDALRPLDATDTHNDSVVMRHCLGPDCMQRFLGPGNNVFKNPHTHTTTTHATCALVDAVLMCSTVVQ